MVCAHRRSCAPKGAKPFVLEFEIKISSSVFAFKEVASPKKVQRYIFGRKMGWGMEVIKNGQV